jgi:hypothetical protein
MRTILMTAGVLVLAAGCASHAAESRPQWPPMKVAKSNVPCTSTAVK